MAAYAQAPAPGQEQATEAIHQYFRRVTQRLSEAALGEIRTLEDWERRRPEYRRQLFEMLGLWPIPERTELHATVTGTVEQDGFTVERLHFQSRPGLYVTANFYRPTHVDKPLPTILYLCGHGNVKRDGVSYGSKANYQHHAAWFAREGYCCLILDTLQLGEIEGLHHGTYREGMWWWPARGYTPAGVEAWNCIRALDYLETRPEVDRSRIGVTGRSGGGIYTWWTAALDDRPACLVPVAGITDLQNYVVDHAIEGHCDCMFMVNTYGWDFPMVAALAAPRPLLVSNTDKDSIFPLDGVVRTHGHLKKIYDLHRAPEKLGLLITEGPHKDTQELQVPAFRWMNRWLKEKDEPITRVADKPFDAAELKVFSKLPEDQINTAVHESFTRAAAVPEPPADQQEWESLRTRWLDELRAQSFASWPRERGPLELKQLATRQTEELELEIYEYTSEENLRIPMYLTRGAKHPKPSLVVLTVVDQAGWQAWCSGAGRAFGELLPSGPVHESPGSELADTTAMLDRFDWAMVTVPPRGIGPNQWDEDKREHTQILRRFPLLGQTADGGRVWDILRAVEAVDQIESCRGARVWLQGEGAAAGIALYAALFTSRVERIDLHRPPTSHRDGPYFLNVLRILDMPQALALVLPRKAILYDCDPAAWVWAEEVSRLLHPGDPPLQFRSTGPR